MSKKGFVIRDKGFGLEDLGWKEGPGDCNFRDWLRDNCPKKCSDKKQKDCVDTITAHCCKHVLNGTVVEREAFQEKAEQEKLPDKFQAYPEQSHNYWSIPQEVRAAQELERKTIENYKSLSYRVAHTAELVAVTVHNNRIRFVCSGEGEKASGFTDYIQYEVEKEDDHDREGESGHAHYGIVSMFLQDLHVTEFFLIDFLYRKFIEEEQRIDHVMICPTLSDSQKWDAPLQDRFEYDKDYVEIQYILKNANLLASNAAYGQPVPFGMYWYYTQSIKEKYSHVDLVLGRITPAFSNDNPIPLILDLFLQSLPKELVKTIRDNEPYLQSQSIKELKKAIRYNETFFRNAICVQYLSWICKIPANELLNWEEKRIIDGKILKADDSKTVAWQMFAASFIFYRSLKRLKDMVSQKSEMNDLMSEDAPYSLADFSAFQLWSDMFTAHACIKLIQMYRSQYKGLYDKEQTPSYSPWGLTEDAGLDEVEKECSKIIHNTISAFPIPAVDRWRKKFFAAFQWDTSVYFS